MDAGIQAGMDDFGTAIFITNLVAIIFINRNGVKPRASYVSIFTPSLATFYLLYGIVIGGLTGAHFANIVGVWAFWFFFGGFFALFTLINYALDTSPETPEDGGFFEKIGMIIGFTAGFAYLTVLNVVRVLRYAALPFIKLYHAIAGNGTSLGDLLPGRFGSDSGRSKPPVYQNDNDEDDKEDGGLLLDITGRVDNTLGSSNGWIVTVRNPVRRDRVRLPVEENN